MNLKKMLHKESTEHSHRRKQNAGAGENRTDSEALHEIDLASNKRWLSTGVHLSPGKTIVF